MKINHLKNHKTKLLKLKLLKNKVYKNSHFFDHYKLEDIESRLKKSLHIIYKFHTYNKKILFVGTPLYQYQQLKSLTKNTKHVIVPESLWVNGAITNRFAGLKHVYKNKRVSEILHQLEKKFDLIIILDQSSNSVALEEGHTARIPIISLNADLNTLDTKVTYKVPGNFHFKKKKSRNNFFYSMLNAVLKKAKNDRNLIQQSKQKNSLNYSNSDSSSEESHRITNYKQNYLKKVKLV